MIHRDASKAKPAGDAPHVAMMLGVIIAEGFIAVEAEDAEEVKDLGRAILTFSNAIGVRKAVVRRANSVIVPELALTFTVEAKTPVASPEMVPAFAIVAPLVAVIALPPAPVA